MQDSIEIIFAEKHQPKETLLSLEYEIDRIEIMLLAIKEAKNEEELILPWWITDLITFRPNDKEKLGDILEKLLECFRSMSNGYKKTLTSEDFNDCTCVVGSNAKEQYIPPPEDLNDEDVIERPRKRTLKRRKP